MASGPDTDGIYMTLLVGEGADAGKVVMILRGAPITEFEGVIVPGATLSPAEARRLAGQLITFAELVETPE